MTPPGDHGEAGAGDDRRFSSTAISVDVLERARRWARFALLGGLIAFFPLIAADAGALALIPPVAALLAWLVLALLPRLRTLGPGPGSLTVEDDALVLRVAGRRGALDPREEGVGRTFDRRIPRAQIVAGYRTDDEVHLRTRRRELIAVATPRPEVAEALLRALGHDAHQRVLELPIASAASRVPGLSLFTWMVLALQIPGIIALPLLLLFSFGTGHDPGGDLFILAWLLVEVIVVSLGARALRRRSVTIGTDGIVFRRFLRARFHPYASVASVDLDPRGVALRLRSGRRLRLRTRGFWGGAGVDPTARALHDRIEIARSAADSARDVHAKLPLLDRRGRPVTVWREHLAALVGEAGYRSAAITPADLGAVIEDAALSPEHRIAAAYALSVAEPEEARSRTRIAVAACADEELRAALDQAAEGEVDEGRLERLARRA